MIANMFYFRYSAISQICDPGDSKVAISSVCKLKTVVSRLVRIQTLPVECKLTNRVERESHERCGASFQFA